MKITRFDGEHLVIVDFPYVISGILFGLLAVLCVNAAINAPYTARDWAGQGLGAVILLIGGAAFSKRNSFDFDKTHRQLSWQRRSLFGRKSGTVPFNDISSVIFDQFRSTQQSPAFRLALVTTNGPLLLTEYSGQSVAKLNLIRDAICNTLGLPITAPDPADTLRLLVASGRSIEAIKLLCQQRNCSLAEAKKIVEELH